MTWSTLSYIGSPGCLFATKHPPGPPSTNLPDTRSEELCRLEAKYIEGVHYKNPFLDLAELHQTVLYLAENGLDWSTQTCLVTLVCAIGAITQQYQDQHMSPENYPIPGAPPMLSSSTPGAFGSEPDLSAQFWSLSVKRLGLTVGQPTVQAVQCLCLAGIWYMQEMDPIREWQYFNLAGSAWYGITLLDQGTAKEPSLSENSGAASVMQVLYITIWKSLCEIRLQLDVPGVFDSIGLPYDFPVAPRSSPLMVTPRLVPLNVAGTTISVKSRLGTR